MYLRDESHACALAKGTIRGHHSRNVLLQMLSIISTAAPCLTMRNADNRGSACPTYDLSPEIKLNGLREWIKSQLSDTTLWTRPKMTTFLCVFTQYVSLINAYRGGLTKSSHFIQETTQRILIKFAVESSVDITASRGLD